MKSSFVGDKDDYRIEFSDKAEWEALGGEVSRDLFENIEDPEKKVMRYIVLRKKEMSWFGSSLVFDPEKSKLTDEDARKLFQSYNVKMLEDSESPEPEE